MGFLGLGSMASSAVTKAIVAGAASGNGSKKGLDLVDSEIDEVLTTIGKAMETVENNNFDVLAQIEKGSFGTGTEATVLANDHAKAHTVVTDLLTGMETDLEKFRTSVKQARTLIYDTDEDARVRLTSTLNRTEAIDLGQYGLANAQDRHRNDPVVDEAPPADTAGDTTETDGA